YVVEGPDGPLYADFHALRHTYLTLLGRGGVDLRTAQELAGHSTPTLTARYSHRRLHDLAGAVEKLPDFLPAPQASVEMVPLMDSATSVAASLQHVVQHVGPGDMLAHLPASDGTATMPAAAGDTCRKYQENMPVSTSMHQPALACISEGDGT